MWPAQAAHVREAQREDAVPVDGHRLAATHHRTVALARLAAEPLERVFLAPRAIGHSRHPGPVLALVRVIGL